MPTSYTLAPTAAWRLWLVQWQGASCRRWLQVRILFGRRSRLNKIYQGVRRVKCCWAKIGSPMRQVANSHLPQDSPLTDAGDYRGVGCDVDLSVYLEDLWWSIRCSNF